MAATPCSTLETAAAREPAHAPPQRRVDGAAEEVRRAPSTAPSRRSCQHRVEQPRVVPVVEADSLNTSSSHPSAVIGLSRRPGH